VLILPFLGERLRFGKWHLDEPWDSPHNRRLADDHVTAFTCPSADRDDDSCTNYVAVLGPNTAWQNDRALKLSDVADGAEDTILLVELNESDIHWAEPRDLTLEQATQGVNFEPGRSISSQHLGEAHVLLGDGSVLSLHEHVKAEDLQALLTIDGGEPVKADEFKPLVRKHKPPDL
jgi:hypothetical protein